MQISMPFADATQDVMMCLSSENGRASNLDLGGVKHHLGMALEVDRKRFIGTSRLDIIFSISPSLQSTRSQESIMRIAAFGSLVAAEMTSPAMEAKASPSLQAEAKLH